MKTIYYVFFILLNCIIFNTNSLFANDNIEDKLALIQSTSNAGKEFYFAITPIHEDKKNQTSIKVYVTSRLKTKVVLSIDKFNYKLEKTSIPNGVIIFDLNVDTALAFQYNAKITKGIAAQINEKAGIGIKADDPITVYVLVDSYQNSEGFLALPYECLGTRYIANSYNDMGWGGTELYPPFASAIAIYDNTKIDVKLGGNLSSKFIDIDETTKNTGQNLKTITLQKGDVYTFSSNGPFQDISGSIITGSKPFSFISSHYCANVPLSNQYCDYLIEQQTPLESWGKTFLIPKFKKRRYNGIIRVFANESNTDIFRDGSFVFNIRKNGGTEAEGWGELRIYPRTNNEGKDQRPKNSVFTSNKPINITFYNTGNQEDAGINPIGSSEPFIYNILPLELFPDDIEFHTNFDNFNNDYKSNIVNLIFELDSNLKIPSEYLWGYSRNGQNYTWIKLSDKIGNNFDLFEYKINGKNYANSELEIDFEGKYRIISNQKRKIMAYISGDNSYESFAYPAYYNYKDLSSLDTLKPKPTYEIEDNGSKFIGVVDDNYDNMDNNVSSKLNVIRINNLNSYNFKFEHQNFEVGKESKLTWNLEVIDKNKSAVAELYFADRAGNDTSIVIEYLREFSDIDLIMNHENEVCVGNIYTYEIEDREFYDFIWDITGDYEIIESLKNKRTIKWLSDHIGKVKVDRRNTKTNNIESLNLSIIVREKPNVIFESLSGNCFFDTIKIKLNKPNYRQINYFIKKQNNQNIFHKILKKTLDEYTFIPEEFGKFTFIAIAINGIDCEDTLKYEFEVFNNFTNVSIRQSNDTLYSNIKKATAFHWYVNSQFYKTTTENFIIPTLNGEYYCQVVLEECISTNSNIVEIVLSITNTQNSEFIIFNDNKELEIKSYLFEFDVNISSLKENIFIYDNVGKVINFNITNVDKSINLKFDKSLSTGVYYLNINKSVITNFDKANNNLNNVYLNNGNINIKFVVIN